MLTDDQQTASGSSASPSARLTPDEIAAALAAAKEFGVDLALLRANLRLTPAQRMERLQAALLVRNALRTARRLWVSSAIKTPPTNEQRLDTLLSIVGQAQANAVIIGGVAMIPQGAEYLTIYFDICFQREPRPSGGLQQPWPRTALTFDLRF